MRDFRIKRLIAFFSMLMILTQTFYVPVYADDSISENDIQITDEDEGSEAVTADDDGAEEAVITDDDCAAEAVITEEADAMETITGAEAEVAEVFTSGEKKKEEPPAVSSMTLISIPTKLIYRKGDNLDLTNGKIHVEYADGNMADLPMKAAMVSNYDNTKPGRQIVHINAGDKYVQFDVDVLNVEAGDDSRFVVNNQEGFPTLTKALNWINNNNDKTESYEIIMFANSLLRALPAVKKAKQLTITANSHYMEFYAADQDRIIFGCDTVLNNVTVKCLSAFEGKTKYRRAMEIRVKKNLTLNNCDFISSGLSIKGRSKRSVVINKSTGIYKLSGFTNTTVNGELEIKDTLSSKRLVMNPGSRITLTSMARLCVKKQFTCEKDSVIDLGKGFKPLEILGNMGGRVKLVSSWPVTEGDLVLKLKYKDILGCFDIDGILPYDGCTYELVKEKDEARLYGHKFMYNGESYTSWKKVISAVNKNGNKETPAEIKLLGSVDIRDKVKMPKSKKMSSLTINGNGHELIFRGNIKLVKDTTFSNITLKGLEDEDNETFPVRFYIYKKGRNLELINTELGLGVVRE